MRAAIAIVAATITLALHAAPARAALAEGRHTLTTAATVRAPCLSIGFDDGTVVNLPLAALDSRIARRPASGDWHDEAERQALIAANRAAGLRGLVGTSAPSRGCTRVAATQVPDDSRYLVATLLDAGAAAVVDAAGHRVHSLLVTVDNPQCRHGPSGMILYALPGARPFLVLTACVV